MPVGSATIGDRWRRDDLSPGTYRATGHLGQDGATPAGVSEAVTLDGGRKSGSLTIRLRPSPTVSFRMVDAASSQPVPGALVTLVREDSTLPPSWSGAPWPRTIEVPSRSRTCPRAPTR